MRYCCRFKLSDLSKPVFQFMKYLTYFEFEHFLIKFTRYNSTYLPNVTNSSVRSHAHIHTHQCTPPLKQFFKTKGEGEKKSPSKVVNLRNRSEIKITVKPSLIYI